MTDSPWELDPRSFRAALARGLGRCVLHLRAVGGAGPHGDALREAFGRTLAYDPQCEGTRVDYLFDLARAARMRGELRAAALASLPACDGRWDADQHVAVALAFARRGDEEAAATLRSSFDAMAPGSDAFDSLAWAIVQLDGPDGLVQAMRRLGQRPEMEASGGSGAYLRSVTIDDHGEDDVRDALDEAARRDPAVAAQLAAMAAASVRPPAPPARALSLSELIESARASAARGSRNRRAIFWGRRASEAMLSEAAEALREAREPWRQEVLALVWWSAPTPGPADVLLPLATSGEPAVAEAAMRALSSVTSSDVRALAWRSLDAGPPRWDALRLLAANRSPGDGERVLARLARVPDDSPETHSIGLDLLDVFAGKNGSNESIEPLRWLYVQTPCSRCRHDAVVALAALDALDPATQDECLWDCNPETREWAGSLADDPASPA